MSVDVSNDDLLASFVESVKSLEKQPDGPTLKLCSSLFICPACIIRYILCWENITLFSSDIILEVVASILKTYGSVEPEDIQLYIDHDFQDCRLCMGILPLCTKLETKNFIGQFLITSGFEYKDFLLNLTTPPSCKVRDHSMHWHLSQLGLDAPDLEDKVINVKRAAKYILGPFLKSLLAVPVNYLATFRGILQFHSDERMPSPSKLLATPISKRRRGPRNKRKARRHSSCQSQLQYNTYAPEYSRAVRESPSRVTELVPAPPPPSMITSEDFKVYQPEMPTAPAHRSTPAGPYGLSYVLGVDVDPLLISGQYCKLQRHVAQTGWGLQEDKMGPVDNFHPEESVAGFIRPALLAACCAEEMIFHSAGREDIDVRMLGDGRPFCAEMLRAKRTPTEEEFRAVEALVEGAAALTGVDGAAAAADAPATTAVPPPPPVRVMGLQRAAKDVITRLSTGSEDKRKTYRAVCWVSRPVTAEELAGLSEHRDLEIHQGTPVRVLHRRTRMIRTRMIHSMAVVKQLSSQYFVIDIVGGAGTYIKEFVHGDLGRTVPSLSSLLEVEEATIVQLDVLAIDMKITE